MVGMQRTGTQPRVSQGRLLGLGKVGCELKSR